MDRATLNQDLFHAAEAGHLVKVRNYLAEGADINSRHGWMLGRVSRSCSIFGTRCVANVITKSYDGTPLHAATRGGFINIVELLLERADNDPNKEDKCVGETPLYAAASSGYISIVKLLLERIDIDPNKENKDNSTPLHAAARNGFIKIVKLLLERADIDPNKQSENDGTPLYASVRGGFINIVKLFLERADIEFNKEKKYDGDTTLHLAVKNGTLNIVQLLSKREDIDPNKKNEDGKTPFDLAADQENLKMVELLFERSIIDPTKVYKSGNTILHIAAANELSSIVQLLLENTNTDPNKGNKDGDTPFDLAADQENFKIVKLLYERTIIDPTRVYKNGDTILHKAVRRGELEIVQMLLQLSNVDPNSTNKYDDTSLHIAVRYEYVQIVNLLIERADVDPNKQNKCYATSLHIAALRGYQNIIRLLLERSDIDPNKGYKYNGDTPLHIAVRRRNLSMVQLLLERRDIDADKVNKENKKTFDVFETRDWNLTEENKTERTITDLIKCYVLKGELRGLGMETKDDFKKVMKLGSYKCYWNRVYIVGPSFSGKSCLTKLLVGDVLPRERESTDGILIYMGRAGMDVNGEEWIVIPKGKAVEEILVNMMRTLSTTECMDITNQTTRLNESEINPHSRQSSMDRNKVEALTVENFAQIDLHKDRIFKSPPRENCDDHDYTFPACVSEQNSQICYTANVLNVERKTIAADSESHASTDISAVGSGTVETALETNKSTNRYSFAGIRMPTVSTLKRRFQTSQTSTKSESGTASSIKTDRSQGNKSVRVREKFKENLMKEVADELSHGKLHEMVISSIRAGMYKQNIIPFDIWDFGGQKDYYMTHQLFITSRGIFVVVFNGSVNLLKPTLNLSFLPGHFGKPTIAVYLRHWVNSILTYCKRSDDGFPRIVFVATHKDKIHKNVEKHRQKLETVIHDIFESHAGLKHLEFKPLIFVNAMNEADPEIQALRQRLMDRAKEHPRWGKLLPTTWVPLEIHLAQQVEKGVNILTMEQLQMFNAKNESTVLTDKQLQAFLKAQHSLGKLLYFDVANLRDFVIITPTYLVQVLRSIVTEKQFWPKGKQLQSIFHTMEKTGALSRNDIDVLWHQQTFKHILSYKDFIIEVLVHLDVLVAKSRNTEDLSNSLDEVSKFIVPSMITRPNNTNYLRKNCKTEKSILLSYKFTEKVIPPAFPYRFIASFVDMWSVKNYKNKEQMLFSDLAVVEVDEKHDVAVQVIENRVIVSLMHAEMKEDIVPTIATSVQECLTAAIHRISEFYSTLSEDSFTTDKRSELHLVMPFEIEFGVHCKNKLCFFLHNKIPTAAKWKCSEHKVHHDVSCLKLWFSEKLPREKCDASCNGLGRVEKEQSPSNRHLRRLASSLEVKECRELLTELGLAANVWNDLQEKFAPSAFHVNDFKYTAMSILKRSCVTDSSFKTIEKKFGEIAIDKHLLCQVNRDVNVDDVLKKFNILEDQANTTPTNDTLQELSNHIGNSSMQLGVELGLRSAEIEEIQNDHSCKLLHQNKEILRIWSQTKFPKPTVKELIKALQRIGKLDCLGEISF